MTHTRRSNLLMAETLGVAGLLAAATWALGRLPSYGWLVPAVAQGFWMQRLYCVGHESSHDKLYHDPLVNRLAGQLALLPLLVPIRVFRKIHAFHHGMNRRDPHTSSLEVFVVPAGAGPLRRLLCQAVWYLAVFAGGWFLHGLVSVILFLLMPPSVARRISPAFRGWRARDIAIAWLQLGAGVALHVGVGLGLGSVVWAQLLGGPLLVFAWVYSVQLYVYHYDTTIGPRVRFHVRSLRASRLTSWWLVNLNHHAVHHRDPTLPWYALPDHHEPPPPGFEGNDSGGTWIGGVLAQLQGARIVEAE